MSKFRDSDRYSPEWGGDGCAACPRALSDDEWDEAIPEPEVDEAVEEEEEEVPAPLRRVVPEEDADDEPEDRPYVPRARRGY